MKHTILLVDDLSENLKLLKSILEKQGFQVHQAPSAKFAASLITKNRGRYALAIVDFHMPEMKGDAATKLFHEIDPDLQIIIVSGDHSEETATLCDKAGAFLVLPRPFSNQRLLSIVEGYCDRFKNKNSNVTPRVLSSMSEVEKFIHSFGIVGASEDTRYACELVSRYAPKAESVLIIGENGTGKERFAKAIHQKSVVRGGPFIPVNCGAIPEGLIESELFGHQRGAFTGAITQKKGFFREADGGTIFLDEIGDLPLNLQVKFLRVLQEREVIPVGASKSIPIDVRIIAATNVDLEAAVKKGKFREDLFYRLNVLNINLVPLKKRPDDIEPLVAHFMAQWQNKTNEKYTVAPSALAALKKYSWPGNVRELENTMTKLFVLNDNTKIIEFQNLEPKFKQFEKADLIEESGEALEIWSRHQIESLEREKMVFSKIIQIAGSLSKASKVTGIPKSTLHDKLKALGVQITKQWEVEHEKV